MKKLTIILACILVAMMSCTKSKEVHPEIGDGNDEIVTVGIKDVHVEYARTDHVELNRVVFHYCPADANGNAQQFATAEMTKKESFFELTLNDLFSDTLYWYYYELFPSSGEAFNTVQKTFHTQAYGTPEPPTPPTPPEGTISVSGDTWFVIDHKYSDGETIHLENATFGLYGAATDAGHQQLISGGERGQTQSLRIGQAGLVWTNYSYVYFNMKDPIPIDEYGYGHSTSIDEGYILNNADVVFSPSKIVLNGETIASYPMRHLTLDSFMCFFADDDTGWDVVENQTATLGTVTITNEQGNVVDKYIPTVDGNGIPCFYNSVSGAYIHHSGNGMPIFNGRN